MSSKAGDKLPRLMDKIYVQPISQSPYFLLKTKNKEVIILMKRWNMYTMMLKMKRL